MKLPLKIISAVTTGIAAVISLAMFSGAYVSSAPSMKPESDSAILARHIREVKVHYALEEFSDHSFNSHLTDIQIDSILAAAGLFFSGGQIIYSPDSVFTLFVVEGEECVRSCNDLCESYLHYNDGSGYVNNRVPFGHVREIAVMNDGKYLVIDEGYAGKTKTKKSTVLSASLISFTDYIVFYHPLPLNTLEDDGTQPHPFFQCAQKSIYPNEIALSYEPKTQHLNYRYVYDKVECCGIDSAYVTEGHFSYVDVTNRNTEVKR